MMKVGIVGLPNAGKSSLFNALSRAGAEAANYPFTTIEPNVAVVPVADERLDAVVEVLHLSGAPDYQLRVACRDTAELDVLLRTLRNRLGAHDTETTIVLRSGPP